MVSISALSNADKQKLRNAISEINDSMVRAAAERDLQKEIINKMNEELGVEKKVIRRMAKVYYKSNFSQEVEENNSFEELYTNVLTSATAFSVKEDENVLRTDGWSNK
jgi:isopentenyldiphosphate isomerase